MGIRLHKDRLLPIKTDFSPGLFTDESRATWTGQMSGARNGWQIIPLEFNDYDVNKEEDELWCGLA